MTFRSRKLLNLLHDTPCMAQFPHDCTAHLSVVPAHANDLLFGRGSYHKPDDCFVAAMCQEAHDFIDGRKGGWPKESKRSEWMLAYVETQRYLWTHEKVKVA